MIGILCHKNERALVQEFFELFKTPWEFLIEGRNYEIVMSTLYEIPRVKARLVIIFSSKPTAFDALRGITVDSAISDRLIDFARTRLPIYGDLVSFGGQGQPLIRGGSNSEIIGKKFAEAHGQVLRVGYNLFDEIAFLLSEGQPAKYALIPTLEAHIALLRSWITDAGIPVVEIPPVPCGYNFFACLTHDVDFVSIRQHRFDHTMWGFAYRATVGSLLEFVRGRTFWNRVVRNWLAFSSLPLVYAGMLKDFWDQFEAYTVIEKDLTSTFFLIPFKNRAGEKVKSQFSNRRATRYDISEVQPQVDRLVEQGFEIGLHGIDAWQCTHKGKQELDRVVATTGQKRVGVRIHWLCFDHYSPAVLEQAGFDYDSTFGYNETIGFKGGTIQVFRPLKVARLLELPLHIQDTALFFPQRMALTDTEAWDLCEIILDNATRFGGVVTVLWHMRSLAPERLWGKFYSQLLQKLRGRGARFVKASEVVQWFRQRRSVTFEEYSIIGNTVRLRLRHEGCGSKIQFYLRVHRPIRVGSMEPNNNQGYFDFLWSGESSIEIPLD